MTTGLGNRMEPQETPGKQGFSQNGCALVAQNPAGRSVDPDLQAVVDAWPGLPPAVKAGIVAMVKAAKSTLLS